MLRTLVILLGCTLPLAGVAQPSLQDAGAGSGPDAQSQPLHTRVDALIAAQAGARPVSHPADDAEFLRRVWLDFNGGIPTTEEARTFLDDSSPEKRTALIERLIAAPRFAERMADAFNVMLMERRGENADWRRWLVESFQADKPWDAMVREILAPDFRDAKQRGAGWFMIRRLEKVGQQDTDYPGLTRDVGRLFMGVDLQCCQCHRHLTVNDYKQADFTGLFVVYQNLKLQADKDRKSSSLTEGALQTKYEFASVLNGKKGQTGPRVPFGEEVPVPDLKGDEVWIVKPDPKKKEMGVPRFSPMREIAQRLPSADNPWFVKNIANRVWFLLMGRGLVEPLDLQHRTNPPTHPELLDLLSRELTAHGFDLRWLIQELALTNTYARSSLLPEPSGDATDAAGETLYLTARERHLSAEQHLRAFLTATGAAECLSKKNRAPAVAGDGRQITLTEIEKTFTAALANPPKEAELKVNPTLRSSLFFRNNDLVLWCLQPHPGNLVDRVLARSDNDTMAEELFLSVLTRRPDADEKGAFAAWMEKHGTDKARALGDFTWALLSSTEWFVNH